MVDTVFSDGRTAWPRNERGNTVDYFIEAARVGYVVIRSGNDGMAIVSRHATWHEASEALAAVTGGAL